MSFTIVDEPCTCRCHQGSNTYHMIIKPCCEKPIDGGKETNVFEIEHKGDIHPVIGETREIAEANFQRFLDS